MVHSRRRNGFHGHQAMESTHNYLIEDDSEAFYHLLLVCYLFFSVFVLHPSFLETEEEGSSYRMFLPFLIALHYNTTSYRTN